MRHSSFARATFLVGILIGCTTRGGSREQPSISTTVTVPDVTVEGRRVEDAQPVCSFDPFHSGYASLRTLGKLAVENGVADAAALERVRDKTQLSTLISSRELVPIPQRAAYALDESFAEHDVADATLYAHVRPWVVTFLDGLLREGYRCFGERFYITSATRTEAYQQILKRWNPHAARGGSPETRTTHTTGSTVDIAGGRLSITARDWLRFRLVELQNQGLISVMEESHSCLHVMVFPPHNDGVTL